MEECRGWRGGGKKVSIPFLLFSFSLLLDLDAKSRSKREKGGEMRYRCSQSRFSSLLFSFLFFFFPLLDFTQSQEVEKRGRERERNNVINVQSKFFIARFLPLRAPVRNRVSISRGSRDYFMNMHRLLLIHIHARVIHNGPLPLDVQRLRR